MDRYIGLDVSFVIGRDGTSSDIEFVTRSGNSSFDTAALAQSNARAKGASVRSPRTSPGNHFRCGSTSLTLL